MKAKMMERMHTVNYSTWSTVTMHDDHVHTNKMSITEIALNKTTSIRKIHQLH